MPHFRFFSGLLLVLIFRASASAQVAALALATVGFQGHGHHGGGSSSMPAPVMSMPQGHHHGGGGGGGNFPGAGHVINYNPSVFYGYGAGGYSAYSPSFFVGSGSFGPPGLPFIPFNEPTGLGFGFLGGMGGPGGLMLPTPPQLNPGQAARAPRPNPARAKELVELGDRAFRGGNTKRAEDRYQAATRADPTSVAPLVRLAQIGLVRGKYQEAAASLRAAVTAGAGSGWLANAPDVQAMFSEPGDFAKQLARLESHLQGNPSDRDAWFVLGAEWYLSGRTRQAADVFQRLTDRQPDEALSAFLEVASPPKADAK